MEAIKLHVPPTAKPEPFATRHAPFLKALAKAGRKGLTDAELGLSLGKSQDNARNRRVELMHLGYVEDTGTKRKSPAGFSATVWRVTKAGLQKARTL